MAKKKNRNMQDMIMGSHSYHNRKPGTQAADGGYTSAPNNTGKKAPRNNQNLVNIKTGNMPQNQAMDI